jgi:hypothetical protein
MMTLAKSTAPAQPVMAPMPVPESRYHGLAARFFRVPSADPKHAIVEVSGRPFPPTIEGGDLVCVDFTHTRLTCDSLYVVILDDGASSSPWIGVRRFQSTPDGWMLSEDHSGRPPQLMTQQDLWSMQIVGRIKQVFKAGGLGT